MFPLRTLTHNIVLGLTSPQPTGSVASFGGHPDVKSDVAASGVFIALYALFGLVHMSIFQRNKRAGHFFIFNGLAFGFCMSRIVTFTMQIGRKAPIHPR